MHPLFMLADVSVVSMAFRLIVSLCIVLGMIAGLAALVRRQKGLGLGFSTKGNIIVRSREQIGRSTTVALLEVGDRLILIGTNENAIEVLAEGDQLIVPDAGAHETIDDMTSSTAASDGAAPTRMNLIEILREWSVRRA